MSEKPPLSDNVSDTRRKAWRDLWEMLDRVHQHPERYEHMTDEWLNEVRDGWDDRLADIHGADYWDHSTS